MAATVVVDALGALKTWLIAHGLPAALNAQRSGPEYLLLTRVGGVPEDCGLDVARISAMAHGPTLAAANALADRFANAIWSIDAEPLNDAVFCTGAEVDSGPTQVPDASGVPRFNVEVSLYLGAL